MHLKRYSTLLVAIGLLNTVAIYSDVYGRLVGITNYSYIKPGTQKKNRFGQMTGGERIVPYTVKIRTSEPTGNLGQFIALNNNSRPSIQNVLFDLKDIQAMNLVAPWRNWSGDHTIHILVTDSNNQTKSQVDIYDDGSVRVHDNYNNKDVIGPVTIRTGTRADSDVNIYLTVDANGQISGKAVDAQPTK